MRLWALEATDKNQKSNFWVGLVKNVLILLKNSSILYCEFLRPIWSDYFSVWWKQGLVPKIGKCHLREMIDTYVSSIQLIEIYSAPPKKSGCGPWKPQLKIKKWFIGLVLLKMSQFCLKRVPFFVMTVFRALFKSLFYLQKVLFWPF